MRALAAKQGKNWRELYELVTEHYRNHAPISEEAALRELSPEERASAAEMLQAWDRGWSLWEAELLMRTTLQDSKRRREAGIVSANVERLRKRDNAYRLYNKIAQELIAENPALERATRHQLAQKVQMELRKRAGTVVSARTIWKALPSKNKD